MTDDDVKFLIDQYNMTAREQYRRLCALWDAMSKRKGPRHISFGASRKWSVNDFQVSDPTRPDIPLGRSVEGLTMEIDDYSLGAE